jgi:hypothetical protein
MADELIRRVIAAKGELLGPSPEGWYDRLEREEPALESELTDVVEHDPQLGLEAVPALYRFWFARGRLDRGRQWIDRLLAAAGGEPTPARAGGLVAAGSAAFRQGDNETAKRDARQALEISRALGRTDLESEALLCLARAGLRDEDPAAVRAVDALGARPRRTTYARAAAGCSSTSRRKRPV